MRLILIRRRQRLIDRVREVLAENDGQFMGLWELAIACNTTVMRLTLLLKRMSADGRVRIRSAYPGGRGHKTIITLLDPSESVK
jgi:hypothetical protein